MESRKISLYIFHILSLNISGIHGIFLRGKGASFPHEVYKSWMPAYKAYRHKYIHMEMTYEAIGSSNGKEAIKQNIGIEYAGTDSLLSAEEQSDYSDFITFPTMAGGVVLSYNIPGLQSQLQLTRDQVVGIYNGTYTYWNDTSLQESNPNSTMPGKRIVVISRADKSGTTYMFTEALSSFNKNWSSVYGTFSDGLNPDTDQPYSWRSDVISYFGKQNSGVSGLVISFKYSIAYLSAADALEDALPHAKIMNEAGNYVQASTTTIQSAMDYVSQFTENLTFPLVDVMAINAYPFAGFTYFVIYHTQMENCNSAKELARYIDWFLKEPDQRQICEEKGMAPLSEIMVQRVKKIVLETMICKQQNVWNMVLNDITMENTEEKVWLIPVTVSVPIFLLAIFALIAYIIFQKMKLLKMIHKNDWHIPIEEIVFFYDGKTELSHGKSKLSGLKSMTSSSSFQEITDESGVVWEILQWPGKWKGFQIGLRLLELKQFNYINTRMKQCMIWMRENIVHTNVVRFYGLTELEKQRYFIGEYCIKGPMTDIIQDHKFNLSNDFKYCLMNDIAFGMQFIHSQGIIHGNLKSSSCLIDGRWIVKISDWEYVKLSSYSNKEYISPYLNKQTSDSYGHYTTSFEDFWVAPEILKSEFSLLPSEDSDVFSYSIILQEIFTREDPYIEHSEYMTPSEVVRAVVLNNLRPEVSDDMPVFVRQVMEIAWSDDRLSRPTFDQIIKMFRKSRSSSKSVLDSMMETMEEYTHHLEQQLEEQSTEVDVLRQNMESLYCSLLPKTVVAHVSKGLSYEADIHQTLGVVVAEIVELEKLLSYLSPSETFSFLTQFCMEFDILCKQYVAHREIVSGSFFFIIGFSDAYKSEYDISVTAAHLGLDILSKTSNLQSPSTVNYQIEMKIGLDIGRAISGVIASTVPRYFILGSVVNSAHALARSSLPSKAHMSSRVWNKLSQIGGFVSEEAGLLTFQGKTLATYWLTDRKELLKDLPGNSEVDAESNIVSGCRNEKTEGSSLAFGDQDADTSRGNKRSRKAAISSKKSQDSFVLDENLSQKRQTPRYYSFTGKTALKSFLERRKIHPSDAI